MTELSQFCSNVDTHKKKVHIFVNPYHFHPNMTIHSCRTPCSAKQLVRGEPNVSYICSRYYRAPELIFGATDYTSSIGKVTPLTRLS